MQYLLAYLPFHHGPVSTTAATSTSSDCQYRTILESPPTLPRPRSASHTVSHTVKSRQLSISPPTIKIYFISKHWACYSWYCHHNQTTISTETSSTLNRLLPFSFFFFFFGHCHQQGRSVIHSLRLVTHTLIHFSSNH